MNVPRVSPYLHSRRVPSADGKGHHLWFDQCLGGDSNGVTPDEEKLLTRLWPQHGGEYPTAATQEQLLVFTREVGADSLSNALRRLFERGFLVDNVASCDVLLLSKLEKSLPAVPTVDQVELSSHCPMQCRFCPRGVPGAITRPQGNMSLRLFEKLLRQLPDRQRIYHPLELDLIGESLLHPDVDRFVERATRHGIQTELSVNPSLLTPELARRLLEAGLARLVVSLDGITDATLVAIRGRAANYERAAANLRALVDLADERPTPPRIVVQMIDLSANRHEQAQFLEMWGNTGKSFVNAYVKPLDGVDPSTGTPNDKTTRFLCTFPFESVSVLSDGDVIPCCRDANARYVLGNLNDSSLEEIWSGAKANELRESYRRDEFADGHLCKECPWRRSRYTAALWERHPDRAVFEPMHW